MSNTSDAVASSHAFAFMSYVSAADKGYFDDPHLAPIKARHLHAFSQHNRIAAQSAFNLSPISNRNTYVRVLLKRTLVSNFLHAFKHQPVQLISLGCGLDTLPFYLMSEFQSLPPMRFVELDLESTVRDKLYLAEQVVRDDALFDQSEFAPCAFKGCKTRHPSRAKSSYHLQPCDLRSVAQLESALAHSGVDFCTPTLVLAEIVLGYLPPPRADDVIRFFAHRFTGARCFLDMDHVITHERLGAAMQNAFAEMRLALLGLAKYPSVESQVTRFLHLGWGHCTGLTMYDAFRHQQSAEQIVQLDRIEALHDREQSHQILSHYGIFLAAHGFDDVHAFLASMDLK